MEIWQKIVIVKNLGDLINSTQRSVAFLKVFTKHGILNATDLDKIRGDKKSKGSIHATHTFYNIIMAKPEAYDVLIKALKETSQIQVLNILNSKAHVSVSSDTISEMEAREHISTHIDELIEHTSCSYALLGFFLENEVLNMNEATEIMQLKNPMMRSKQFYTKIQSRDNFFHVLLIALQKTQQTDALKILKQPQLSKPKTSESSHDVKYEDGVYRGMFSETVQFDEIGKVGQNLEKDLIKSVRVTKQTKTLDYVQTTLDAQGTSFEKDLSNFADVSSKLSSISSSGQNFKEAPKYLIEFRQNADQRTLIVSSLDCNITLKRILETDKNCQLLSVIDVVRFSSLGKFKSSTKIFVSIWNEKIEDTLKMASQCKEKIILITDKNIHNVELANAPLKFKHDTLKLIEESITWADLSENKQLQITLSLQIYLGVKILGTEIMNELTRVGYSTLIKLINAQYDNLLKTSIPETLSYYIPRQLKQRNVLSSDFLLKGLSSFPNTVFVFSGIELDKLNKMLSKSEAKLCPSAFSDPFLTEATSFYVALDPAKEYPKICKLFDKKSVHLIKFDGIDFIWQKSKGSIHIIQRYLHHTQHTCIETDLFNEMGYLNENQRYPVCISGSPGMGKSTLLGNIAQQLQLDIRNKVVVYMDICQVIRIVKGKFNQSKAYSLDEAIEAEVINRIGDTKLITEIVKQNKFLLQELFLDDLDKLESEDENLGHDFLKAVRSIFPHTRLWVTTRLHLLSELENTFQVMGYTINGFSEGDQISFLTALWTKNRRTSLVTEKIISYASHILDEIKSILSPQEPHFTATSLYFLYVAEYFEADFDMFCKSKYNDIYLRVSKIHHMALLQIVDKIVQTQFTRYLVHYQPSTPQTQGVISRQQSLAFNIIRNLVKFLNLADSETLSMKDLQNVLIYQSLLVHFPLLKQDINSYLKTKLCSKDITLRQILRCGFMQAENLTSTPIFVNRIFAEYFIAIFSLDCFQGRYNQPIITQIITTVLKTNKTQVELPTGPMDSFEFKNKAICYFIDGMLGRKYQEKSIIFGREIFGKYSKISIHALLKACVSSNFTNIFSRITHELSNFTEILDSNFVEEVLIQTVIYERLDMFEIISRIGISRNVNIASVLRNGYGLLHFAVINGNYEMVEHLAERHQSEGLLPDNDLLSFNLLYINISNTLNLKTHKLHQRSLILNYLALKFPQLLTSELSKQIFLEFDSINLMLYTEFLTLIVTNVDILKYAINKITINLSSVKYMELLNILFKNHSDGYIGELINSTLNDIPLLHSIITNIEPHHALMVFLNRHSKQFSVKVSNESIFVAALRKQRNIECLTWLLDNMDLSDNDALNSVEILFKYYETANVKQVINLMNVKFNYMCANGHTYLHKLFSRNANSKLDLLEITEFLVGMGVDAHSVNNDKETPLHLLASSPNFSLGCWKYLVKCKANILATDLTYRTPISRLLENMVVTDELAVNSLKYLFKSNDTGTVKRAINFICSTTTCRPTSANILLHALVSSKENININMLDTTQVLIDKGADMHYVNNTLQTALHVLASNSNFHPNCWNLLISNGADICALDNENHTPVFELIMNLAKQTNANFIQHVLEECNLLNNEMCVEWKDPKGNSLLHYAAEGSNVNILRLIFSFGIDTNSANNKKETPLHVLAKSSKFSLECWNFLVENKADVVLEDEKNQTPISQLNGVNIEDILDALVFAIKVYDNGSLEKLENIIWLVISSLNCDVVKYICQWWDENKTCNLDNIKVNNLTLLDAALRNDDGSVDEYVYSTLNCKNISCSPPITCIHNLVVQNNSDENGMIDLIAYLCKLYPNLVNSQNDKGQTPLCIKDLNSVFIKPLITLGANINYCDENGNTPLHWAILNNCNELIFPISLLQELLDCRANVNAENSKGETSLLLITQLKYKFDMYDCFRRLISIDNVDLRKKYSSGNTILHMILPHVSAEQFEEIKVYYNLKACDDLLHVKNEEGKSPLELSVRSTFFLSAEK